MIIAKAPFRISFFGGGTDYPEWYLREGGAVMSTSIDKYCYISARMFPPFFPNSYRIVWSHIENVSSISEILHPAVREGLRMMDFERLGGVEIHHQGDLPARSGMGSSSAFANGLLLALSALEGHPMDQTDLYQRSIALEQEWLKEKVGSQDQVATAIGGFNIIRFGTDGGITPTPVPVSQQRLRALNSRLLLVFTGTCRFSSEIAGQVINSLNDRTTVLRAMHEMVDVAADLLCGTGDLDDFGRMLHDTWLMKRSLTSAISTQAVDDLYETARQHGALGGKLLGAGGSGFMLFYVPPDRQAEVLQALRLLHVPFRFENHGAHLIQNHDIDKGPNDDHAERAGHSAVKGKADYAADVL